MKKIILSKCKCGKEFETTQNRINSGRGKFCSKKCQYEFMQRPSGLIYIKHKENPTVFKRGNKPWNAGTKGLCISWNKGIKGLHFSPETEFKPGQMVDEKNNNWKGDEVGYFALHTYIIRKLGKADNCKICNTKESKLYVWHNISGKYKRDYEDWISLCQKCHLQLHHRLRNIKMKKEVI